MPHVASPRSPRATSRERGLEALLRRDGGVKVEGGPGSPRALSAFGTPADAGDALGAVRGCRGRALRGGGGFAMLSLLKRMRKDRCLVHCSLQ